RVGVKSPGKAEGFDALGVDLPERAEARFAVVAPVREPVRRARVGVAQRRVIDLFRRLRRAVLLRLVHRQQKRGAKGKGEEHELNTSFHQLPLSNRGYLDLSRYGTRQWYEGGGSSGLLGTVWVQAQALYQLWEIELSGETRPPRESGPAD